MKKENVLTYLEKILEETLVERYDWALDWDTKNHEIRLFFRFFVQNVSQQAIIDEVGTLASDIIEFEDSLSLYTKTPSAENLVAFPFQRKKGIEKAQLKAIIQTLEVCLEEGESDLLDFVCDEQANEFELHWPTDIYERCYEAEKAKDASFIAYPKF